MVIAPKARRTHSPLVDIYAASGTLCAISTGYRSKTFKVAIFEKRRRCRPGTMPGAVFAFTLGPKLARIA
jgi:hypothetical protein